MKVNRVLIIVIICFNFIVSAQKPQKVGYIDMNYILENVPEYVNAQAQLDTKVKTWQQKLDGLSKEIDQMNTELTNEKPLLTEELINEREEELGRVRASLVEAQEENKLLTVTREKIRQQNDFLAKELKTMEYDFSK